MITWHVGSEGLKIYRGHELLCTIEPARFAILLYDLIKQMRNAP